MATSPLKRALVAGLIGFLTVFPIALFVFDYGLQQSLAASIGPAVGVTVGVFIANWLILQND